jgi:hypothetical protein
MTAEPKSNGKRSSKYPTKSTKKEELELNEQELSRVSSGTLNFTKTIGSATGGAGAG